MYVLSNTRHNQLNNHTGSKKLENIMMQTKAIVFTW